MLRICTSWSRKSSRSKPLPFFSFWASFGGLALVDRTLHLVDQREHVAHAEDARGDAVRVEGLQGVGLSPTPMNLIGLPVMWRTDRAAPPGHRRPPW
jgi:hypothetical protein